MGIVFDPVKRSYTLHTEHTTYQLQADRFDRLLHLYYGRRSEGRGAICGTGGLRGARGAAIRRAGVGEGQMRW